MRVITLIFLAILLSACGSKKIYFKHQQHGTVQTKSDIFKSERAKCDLEIFGDGIVLSDRVLKSRSEVISYIAYHAVKQYRTKSSVESWEPREKEEEINLALDKSSQCIRDKGWERVE